MDASGLRPIAVTALDLRSPDGHRDDTDTRLEGARHALTIIAPLSFADLCFRHFSALPCIGGKGTPT